MMDDIMIGLVCLFIIFLFVRAIIAIYDFLVEVPRQLKRIADKMEIKDGDSE